MASENVEIEIKFKLFNAEQVTSFLESNGKLVKSNEWQLDTYYTPAHKNFLDVKYPFQWLRIRESDKGVQICYKHFHPENVKENDYCDEYESDVSNENIKMILSALEFRIISKVNKNRSSWLYKKVEISIDWIDGLGCFIELEAMSLNQEPSKAKLKLIDISREIGAIIGEEIHEGYPMLLIKNKR